ncbi:Anti-anti-sigma regulatory factor (antagonist of anti-sigma factor) [Actinacidiphila paucisporea]|uniref:Anti-anti-sigma regulatory factor (Antagonist of anti-sigma factor) n=2 Tax=Actinacidiphila paucisporea TaxID=310782 RepID=A0A1M7LQC2_9ACTN|nr:Anti-anti-sigma regulatory factor (antagonist of anti-sigma factor) [Actinacidiphila paucisporea]
MELTEAVDPETEDRVERDLVRRLRARDVEVVVIDVRTPLVTTTALHLLMRLRESALAQGAALCVVARHPLARRVFRAAGLSRALRVSATMGGTQAVARGCPRPDDRPDASRGAARRARTRPSRHPGRHSPR